MKATCAAGAMLLAACSGAWGASAKPEGYPARPIRLIVGFTPGGSDDLVGRLAAGRFSERLGQSVIVDNRPGAGGNVGAEITARSTPDGYTLSSVGSITLASSPSLYPKLGYDPLKDFTFISRVAIGANVLFAQLSLPAKSVKELIALARAKPKSIGYGTPGVASLGHLAVELLQSTTKTQLVHVPYKGPAAAVTAVLGGEVPVGIGASTAVIPMIQAKRVQPLAVTSAKRLGPLPNVPTVAEGGFSGFEVTNNHGILGPAGVAAPIVKLLNAEIQGLLQTEEARAKLASYGLEVAGSTPEEFRRIVQSEFSRWTRVIREAGIVVK
ncbi:MAG TPA: tripartite tricarboxylate transporter substrate binding protein [Burkholderiales bacterium]|nr:tripartite tricarboxylate transporter substrate binding protein [Burkholderiales bacterium]